MSLIIDGKAIAQQIRQEVAVECAKLKAAQGVVPGLAVVLVGHDPASQVYVRNKKKACEEAGMVSFSHELPADISMVTLLEQIDQLNHDPRVHGILVQLPLPNHLDSQRILQAIAPHKDADGFHPYNIGLLQIGTPSFRPCTPWGIMELLRYSNIDVAGRHTVVLGRSNIVGKPMASMLLAAHATVTICHSRTVDLASHVARADIVIAAVGQPAMVAGEWIKPGATVIDVGIHRTTSGSLCGDVDFSTASQRAGAITPVPGGVGPMTIAMLLKNTLFGACHCIQ
ncbi:MAG: bifunctional methylenetetrahydrofolate dehydrogenase/methenyltetrahydrofolate cyclohydrolase FolD [Magnetococcales bacterium]|nr:bifunctional methylenetetrahydrofolate dehydrogenase/methenyltetrahydrofolate cyclohydrolase FolD [Magnetococcales bacterium]